MRRTPLSRNSVETAACFLALRSAKPGPYRQRKYSPSSTPAAHLAKTDHALPARIQRRITCDFAEPTLRAIHEALVEQIMSGHLSGDALHRTIIAEHMVAQELGEHTWLGRPVTDESGLIGARSAIDEHW